MATAGKATKKEKKKPVLVKTSLNNPYDLKWKPLEKGHARFILKTVTDKFVSVDLRKRHEKVYRKWRGKRRAKKGNTDSVDAAESTQDSHKRSGSDPVDTTESTQESHERGCSDSVDTTESTQESHERGCSDSVGTAESTQESYERGCSDSVNTAESTHESHERGCSDSVNTAESTQESHERGCSDSVNTAESTQESHERVCSDPMDTAESTQESHERGWTNKHLRNEVAIGINEVTKGLEKNELGLVLVCDSVKPAHMTSHLISLSQTRSVPACQVPGLSASLAGSLGLTSVLALGFKRQSGVFADTVAALAPKVPPLGLAWVPTAECEPQELGVSGETEEQQRARKRKLEDSPGAQNPGTLLQPLKVKKIVPNPSKIRKLKIKKAKK